MKFHEFYFIIGLIFSLLIFCSPDVQVNQTLHCKLKLGMFEPRAFDYFVEPQLTSCFQI